MLNMGFKDELDTILASTPESKQTLLFSATFPTEVEAIAKNYMTNPVEVTSGEKRTLVDDVFSDVANKYDLMNDLMSFGIHRVWKEEFCRMIPNLNSNILDVAGGTGDISFRLQNNAKALGANAVGLHPYCKG